jgi:hypothetical protein
MMVIPTDKTDSYKVIYKEKYTEWVLNHLKPDATEVSADKLVKIHEEGMNYCQHWEIHCQERK